MMASPDAAGTCYRIAFCVGLLALAAGCVDKATPVAFADPIGPYHEGARLVVVGDLQRTSFLEFWREQNDPERAIVVNAIAAEHPDLVAITGDCVFDGSSDAQWRAFDDLMAPVHSRHIPVVAAFGNHEYWAGPAPAASHFFPRFPLDGNAHFFTVRFGPLQLVVLDGNKDVLKAAEWRSQTDWYEKELDALDRDPAVLGVFVVLHQPPYTNSTVTGDEVYVQTDIVPPMLKARKTMAMLSGHVHSYERYSLNNRTFVVSGGGGGPRARLETGEHRRHPDDKFDGPALRDFNFTVYTVTRAGVQAEVRGLPKGGTAVRVMDVFSMAWP
jgi:hypothetical protein